MHMCAGAREGIAVSATTCAAAAGRQRVSHAISRVTRAGAASRFGRGRYLKILQPIVQDKKAVVPQVQHPAPQVQHPAPQVAAPRANDGRGRDPRGPREHRQRPRPLVRQYREWGHTRRHHPGAISAHGLERECRCWFHPGHPRPFSCGVAADRDPIGAACRTVPQPRRPPRQPWTPPQSSKSRLMVLAA